MTRPSAASDLFSHLIGPPIVQGNMVRNGDLPPLAPRAGVAALAGKAAVKSVKRRADRDTPGFTQKAAAFVVLYLRVHGRTSAEDLTDACIKNGHTPNDLRAFGAVYSKLRRDGMIEIVGTVTRRRGHGTGGGKVYDLAIGHDSEGGE